jgi:riboflavin synthase
MFTGIIQHLGLFKRYGRGKRELIIEAPLPFPELAAGESVSINGVCLSLTRSEGHCLVFDLSQETLHKTNLGSLKTGERLNLETPLTLQTPLGGHFVTGHIDGRGKVLRRTERRPGRRVTISFSRELRPYFVPQGSVTVNGVSLTIAELGPTSFEVELIPLTIGRSNLGELKRGQEVNLECDILGKYVYNWKSQGHGRG